MEKTADFQYVVYKKNGVMILRLPGGQEIPYDNRFADCPSLMEGESFLVPKEN